MVTFLQNKEKAVKTKRELEDKLDEMKEQMEDNEAKLNDMEDQKHKKELEVEEVSYIYIFIKLT